MNKLAVRFGIMVIVGAGALHAAAADGVKRLSPEDILALGQTVTDMFVADAGAGAPPGSQAGGAGTERRISSLQRWYDSACCRRTADVLTNPAVQGSLQVAMIVLGTTLVASYLMLIPAGLLLIGGAAAKIVKRQQQLDAIARGDVAPGSRAGYADTEAIKDEIRAERIALASAFFETAEGRGYVASFNAAMRRLGNPNQIVQGQPAPEVVVKMVSAVVRGVLPVAGDGLTRGAGASAGGALEEFIIEPDYEAVLNAVFPLAVVPVV